MADLESQVEMFKILAEKGLLSRRAFMGGLAVLGGMGAIGFLGACGATPTPTAAPAATEAAEPTKAPPTAQPAASPSTGGFRMPTDAKLEGKGEVIRASWGGVTEENNKLAYDPFFAEYYGGKVIYDPYDYGKLKAMVESKMVTWDSISDSDNVLVQAANEGLIQKIDFSCIPMADELVDAARGEYWASGQYEAYVMGYNKEKYGDNPPQNWADFYDVEKFPGARALCYEATGNIDMALMADGVAPDKLAEAHKDPGYLDRALERLTQLRSTGAVKKFWTSGAESQQLMKDKEVDLIVSWCGRLSNLIMGGVDYVGVQWGQQLWYLTPLSWVKDAPNGKNALHYMNVTCIAEAQAKLQEKMMYGPTNPKAIPMISEKARAFLPSNPENMKTAARLDPQFWSAELPRINDQWNAFMMA